MVIPYVFLHVIVSYAAFVLCLIWSFVLSSLVTNQVIYTGVFIPFPLVIMVFLKYSRLKIEIINNSFRIGSRDPHRIG